MIKLFFTYIKYLFQKQECAHSNVCTENDMTYCPDCGELIEINWYLLRCKCCGKKRTGIMKNGVIFPLTNYCSNCGVKPYVIEKIKNINYFDINFAVIKKEPIQNNKVKEYSQVWIEKVTPPEKTNKNLPLLPKLASN